MLKNKFDDLVSTDMFWILVSTKYNTPLIVNDSVTHYASKSQVPALSGYHPERVYDVYKLNDAWVMVM